MPPKAQGSLQKRGQKDHKGQRQMTSAFWTQQSSCTHGLIVNLTAHTRSALRPDKIPEWRGGVGMKPAPGRGDIVPDLKPLADNPVR